jgi:integrase
MPLTDVEIRKAKPSDKLRKLSDGGGLQLWITADGAKYWRLAYRFAGKQKVLALGVYPTIGLREARAERESAKALLAYGRDPGQAKKLERAARASALENTFAAVAEELLEKKRLEKRMPETVEKIRALIRLAAPAIGARPIGEITAAEILPILRSVGSRGTHVTAMRLRATIGAVFRLAIATGRAENDPTGALKGALAAPVVKHRAAIVEPKAFGALLRAIDGYHGAPETKAALELLALTFVRPGELRAAEWAEFDLDASLWLIPASKMKMRREHRVPLAPRAVTILRQLQAITGGRKYLFPSIRSASTHMSENTLSAALRRMGYAKDDMSAHGFRAAASSILNESGLWHGDAIERQLAHVDKDAVRRAYARADFWEERIRMMNWWADRCDELRRGGEIVHLRVSGKSA